MVIIWKGIGIIVPIALVGIGYVVSLFYDDRKLGNTDLVGWTLLYTSLLCLLVGLAVSIPSEEEREHTQQKLILKKHTFFFIPILFWGILLLGISIYLLAIYDPNKKNNISEENFTTELSEEEKATVMNFYNPTNDTLVYYIIDKNGEKTSEELAGYQSSYQFSAMTDDRSYLIGSKTSDGNLTLLIGGAKENENYDKDKFLVAQENGKEFLLRKIPSRTTPSNDYDEIWILVDQNYNLALIDISDLYQNGKLNRDLINKTNWKSKIRKHYSGNDIIEVKVSHPDKKGAVEIVGPNSEFPEEIADKTDIYFLIDYLEDKDLTEKYMSEEINRLTE